MCFSLASAVVNEIIIATESMDDSILAAFLQLPVIFADAIVNAPLSCVSTRFFWHTER